MEENSNKSRHAGNVRPPSKAHREPDGRIQAAIWLALLGGFPFFYGCWGMFTEAGHEEYDEMDGMIPLAYLLGAVAMLMASAVLAVVGFLKRRPAA